MSRRGAVSFGCVLWGVLIMLVLVIGWKLLDFYILGPAKVKRALNTIDAHVMDTINKDVKQSHFLRLWSELRDSPDGLPVEGRPYTGMFSGDTFVVVYMDTLPIPGFPPLTHRFRLTNLVR
jgi:hypothetical protein